MQNVRWKKRPLLYILITTIAIYLLLRLRYYKHEDSVLLHKVNPMEVWEFVADFSNMKYLNPTIIDFNILDESGNYEHWKYSTIYSEHLSHWPYLANRAVGHFDVKANENKDIFYINSTHRTCLLDGHFCVNSKSTFKFFKSSPKETMCHEIVEFQCPVIFSTFCTREVQFQRNAIMKNLKLRFQK